MLCVLSSIGKNANEEIWIFEKDCGNLIWIFEELLDLNAKCGCFSLVLAKIFRYESCGELGR